MGRSSRLRDRGGGRRRRRRSGGRTSKKRAQGEMLRRRRRRGVGRARQVNREEAQERENTQEKGRKVRESRRRGGGLGGLRRRREVKNGDREKRKRRTNGEYRRRLGRGRVGAVVMREVGDRRERYLGRERRALSTYVMVGYRRGSAYATEAGRKYYRVGTRGSCRRLRGRTMVYGETGRVKREERGCYMRTESSGSERTKEGVGRMRMRWVMRFKRGARPVHRWVADIYEGAPSMAGRYLRVVPKRSRRIVRVRRRERTGPSGEGEGARGGRKRTERRRRVCGRGSVRVGGRGRLVNRRWKRYMGYSGIGNVGNMRRGGRRRTEEGRKGRRRTVRAYFRMVRRRWGGMRRRGVERRGHEKEPGKRKGVGGSKERRERKYLTERRGRGKENRRMGMTRTRGRMSRVGRPPRLGFGAKRSVYRARVEQGRGSGEGRYRERGGRGLLRGMAGGYGYLRMVKRMRMEESREGERKRVRRKRKVEKEGGRRRGVGTRRLRRGWRNGEGVERRRERRGREVRKRVK
jgi:hypothetical protein